MSNKSPFTITGQFLQLINKPSKNNEGKQENRFYLEILFQSVNGTEIHKVKVADPVEYHDLKKGSAVTLPVSIMAMADGKRAPVYLSVVS